jgi:uncharacterized linocin/CFP29 family protein
MIRLDQFRMDSPISEEQYKLLDSKVYAAARKILIGRQLIPFYGPLGLGVQQVSHDVLTEMADAIMSFVFQTESQDIINLTRTNLKVPVLSKEFEIDRRDIESSRRYGTPLDLSAAGSAAYKVALLEDDLIINGYAADGTNLDINGLYNAAGNDYSTTKDFGTAGNALAAVAGAMDLLMADSIFPPYNMVLNPTQFMEAKAHELSTGSGRIELDVVKELIGGNIFATPTMAAAKGMLLATPNDMFFDLAVAQDLTTETEILPKTKNLYGRVFECVVPRIKDSNAICKLSSI